MNGQNDWRRNADSSGNTQHSPVERTGGSETLELIRNLQEALELERKTARRLEEQLVKSQQRWNFFFNHYEGMLKAQIDPIFDQVDAILAKIIAAEHSARGAKLSGSSLKKEVEALRHKAEKILSDPPAQSRESSIRGKVDDVPHQITPSQQIFHPTLERPVEVRWTTQGFPAMNYVEPANFTGQRPPITFVDHSWNQNFIPSIPFVSNMPMEMSPNPLVIPQASFSQPQDARESHGAQKVGIGIVLGRFKDRERAGKYFIIEVTPGGAAARTGEVEAGDALHAVDGVSLHGMDQRSVSALVSGPSGSAARLTLGRSVDGGEIARSVVILRD